MRVAETRPPLIFLRTCHLPHFVRHVHKLNMDCAVDTSQNVALFSVLLLPICTLSCLPNFLFQTKLFSLC